MSFQFNPGQQKAWDNLLTCTARFCLIYGGSRSGKTFLMVYTILTRALKSPGSRHLIVRQEATSAKRAIAKGTLPEVVKMCFPSLFVEWKEQYGYFLLPNGSEIWVGGLNDDKALEKILGTEYTTIYINEASEVRYNAFSLLRTRLAQTVDDLDGDQIPQRFYVDLNPTTRNHWTYRLWIDKVDPEDQTPIRAEQYLHETINPYDNQKNLSADFLADLEDNNIRAKKRFLLGEYVEDVESALWQRRMLKRVQKAPDLVRINVSVDPAISSEPGSDETGITCQGIDAAGIGYFLADDSGKYRPEEWARKAVALYHFFGADRIVAEKNQGGDMVESVLRSVAADIPYTGVTATRGKYIRAEPVASLYERGKVFHVGEFSELEDQMCSFTSDFDRKAQGYSPDRVDALVWGFTDLFPQMTRRVTGGGPIIRKLGTVA